MKKYVLFFAAAAWLLICGASTGWAAEELDPNILWVSDSTVGRFEGFAIHPNGNVLAYKNSIITELEVNTGKFIRKFPIIENMGNIKDMKISADGKYIVTGYGSTYIINYETGALVKSLKLQHVSVFPDNNRIIGITTNHSLDSGLAIYDIKNDKFEYYKMDMRYSNMELSPDGKYFATGIAAVYDNGRDSTELKLWNTETHTIIKTLGKFSNANNVNYIKFTPDSKYVGFQVFLNDLYIYNTSDLSLYKHYNKINTENGVFGFCFIDNKHIGIKSLNTYIIRLADDKQIFKQATSSSVYCVTHKNFINNSLIIEASNLVAFNLYNIMTTVKDENTVQKLTIAYSNGILSLDNIQTVTNSLSITILDINGKIINQLNIHNSNNSVKIPMKLIDGTYILSIKDGEKVYSSKFLVAE